MAICKVCGGTMKLVNNKYICNFCGSTIDKDNYDENPSFKNEKLDSGAMVYEKNCDAILEIFTQSSNGEAAAGSGFLISSDGYAITNTHVVTFNSNIAETVVVILNNKKITTKVIAIGDDQGGRGSGVDLALLKLMDVSMKTNHITFADSNLIKNGQKVFAVGNSLGYGTCITEGIVSDKLRNVNGKSLIMTDCAINGGNSGGPLFDANGKVIGMVVSGITDAEGMNFAIPSNTIQKFIEECKVNIKK